MRGAKSKSATISCLSKTLIPKLNDAVCAGSSKLSAIGAGGKKFLGRG